jgi:DNA-binding winged helix-turn-helix (wHTH) protein
LGGQPHLEVQINQSAIDEYETESKQIQRMLQDAKNMIVKRIATIRKKGFASRKRVIEDEKINKLLKESEANLEILK